MKIGYLPPSLHLHGKDDEARLIARANDSRVALDIVETSGTAPAMTGGGSNLGGLDSFMSSANLSAKIAVRFRANAQSGR